MAAVDPAEPLRYDAAPDAPIVVQLLDGSLVIWPTGEPFDPVAYASPFAAFFEAFSRLDHSGTD